MVTTYNTVKYQYKKNPQNAYKEAQHIQFNKLNTCDGSTTYIQCLKESLVPHSKKAIKVT
jgi:hypothetical protein